MIASGVGSTVVLGETAGGGGVADEGGREDDGLDFEHSSCEGVDEWVG